MAELFREHAPSATYIVLEQAHDAAPFFAKYPIARKLISINKRFVGRENHGWSWRHDWNSLMNGRALRVGSYTDEYYPHADKLHQYLKDFSRPLNVRYNFRVDSVRRISKSVFHLNNGDVVCTRGLIVATGFSVPFVPEGLKGSELALRYDQFDTSETSRFRNKTVLILGNGNSAFEMADLVLNEAAYIHIGGRSHLQLSYQSHYVGNVRAVNSRFLDHYELKSLDGHLIIDANKMELYRRKDGKIGYFVSEDGDEEHEGRPEKYEEDGYERGESNREGYDFVLLATGWRSNRTLFSIGNVDPEFGSKYPVVKPTYESVNEANVWFVGALMHSLDLKKSAGGFIHGFRYLTRGVFDILSAKHSSGPQYIASSIADLAKHMMMRINYSHAAYQMFSMMGDVVVLPSKCSGAKLTDIHVHHNVLLKNLGNYAFCRNKRLVVFSLDYGSYHHGPSILNAHIAGEEFAHESQFLHPIFREARVNRGGSLEQLSEFHLLEDFLTLFDSGKHHMERLHKKLADIAVCNQSMFLEPSEAITADVFQQKDSADVLAHQSAKLAQKMLFSGQPEEAAHIMKSSLKLWHDRPSKLIPVLIFISLLEKNITRFNEAKDLAYRHLEHPSEMIQRALEETGVLKYGDTESGASKVSQFVESVNAFNLASANMREDL